MRNDQHEKKLSDNRCPKNIMLFRKVKFRDENIIVQIKIPDKDNIYKHVLKQEWILQQIFVFVIGPMPKNVWKQQKRNTRQYVNNHPN